ncbi:hypothetical protein DFH06DRAFT_1132109 [Mycena polygramma]|nr:hypothetical protein DFH06DRAFT_1132109 [Mycena polygramma]
MCPQTRSRSSANFRSRLSRPSPVAQQPRARPSQRGPSAGARGPPSMRWWLLSVRALRWGYFEKEKNVLVVADRREQPVQTSYRALLLLTQRPPRDIPVFGQGKNVDLSVDYSPPYSAFTHDGARHRGPIRARRSWAIQRGSKIRSQKHFPEVKLKTARSREIRRTLRRFTTNNKISSSWSGHRSLTTARRDLVSSRRAVLLKIDLFVLLSEGERCGATSAGGGWRRSREASSCLVHRKGNCSALSHFPAPFSRVTAGTSVQLIKSGKVSHRGTEQCFGSRVRHFRPGELWPIAKRPSAVGQRTARHVDAGIPSVASIGLKLWDPRWTLLGSEGKPDRREPPRVKRCETAQSTAELEGAQGVQRPRGAETWASAKEKKSVRYNISRIKALPSIIPYRAGFRRAAGEEAARTIEYRALLPKVRWIDLGGVGNRQAPRRLVDRGGVRQFSFLNEDRPSALGGPVQEVAHRMFERTTEGCCKNRIVHTERPEDTEIDSEDRKHMCTGVEDTSHQIDQYVYTINVTHPNPFVQFMERLVSAASDSIVDKLAYDDDDSSTSIAMGVTSIFNFRLTCRAIRSLCFEYGPAWANIPLALPNFGPPVEDAQTWFDAPQHLAGWGLPQRVPRLEELRARLARSRGFPLRISFNLGTSLSAHGPSEGNELLAELVLHRERWAVMNMEGPTACNGTTACAKASAISADFARPGPNLKTLSLTTSDYASRYACVASHARQAVVDISDLQKLTATIPITLLHLVDASCLASKMVYLDIGNQISATIVPLLAQTPNLRTLRWRKNHCDVHTPVASIPSLRHLFLDSSSEPPPVIASELISFTSNDIGFVLNDITFRAITGGFATINTLKTVDIIGSYGSEERTELFRMLGDQVANQYIYRRTSELETVSCHGMRHCKSRDIYTFLQRLGISDNGPHIRFHPAVFMVRSGPCTGKFNVRDAEVFCTFKEENRLDSTLVLVAMYEAYFDQRVPHDFTLAIIFSTEKAARDCVERGVVFRSRRCSWASLI